MKKLFATILSVALGFSLMVPAGALAAGTAPATQAPDEISKLLGEIEAQKAANAPVPASLQSQRISKLLDAKKLQTPEALKAAANENANGIMFSGTAEQFASGRFVLTDELDFGKFRATRFSFDGLSEKGIDASVSFFLDDEAEPFTTLKMKHERGKVTGWASTGNLTVPIERAADATPITGAHKVSFAIGDITKGGAAYTKETKVLLRSFEFAVQTLPTLWFDIEGGDYAVAAMNASADKNEECYGSVTIQTPAGYACEYTDAKDLVTSGTLDLEYIRGRGNSTWDADKKPYKMKLASKANLFGMGANKHWTLLANRYDNSMMRNKATYWLGQQLGMEFTPECIFVDVVMNGTYYGSYYLCEQVRVGKSRVDIQDLEDCPDAIAGTKDKKGRETITGGYLLSASGWGTDEVEAQQFKTEHDWGLYIESPSFEDHTDAAKTAQHDYIKNFVQKAEDAVYADGFKNDEGTSYKDLFDIDAAVDFFWIQDFSMNGDAWESGSNYLYKDRDKADGTVSKLKWGPLWDFDYVAWGNLDYGDNAIEYDEQGNPIETPKGQDDTPRYNVEGMGTMHSAPWASRLLSDEEFVQAMKARWSDKLKPLLQQMIAEGGLLDQYYEQLKVSEFYDDEIWNSYIESLWGYSGEDQTPTLRSYKDELEQFRGWISQRLEWVDANLSLIENKVVKITFKADGKPIATKEYIAGNELGELVAPPKKAGYVFGGWMYTDAEGFPIYLDRYSCAPESDLTVEAEWIDEEFVTQPEAIFFPAADIYLRGPDVFGDSEGRAIPFDIAPLGALYSTITWTSSDPTVATVDSDGYVIPLAEGTTTITAKLDNGITGSYCLHVVNSESSELTYPDFMSIDKSEIEIPVDGYEQLQVTYDPTPWYYSDIRWISLDPSIVDVGSTGLVSAYCPGTTYILAIDEECGFYAYSKVTVTEPTDDSGKVSKSVVINKAKVTKKAVKQALKKAKNTKATTVVLGKKVKSIAKGAFAGTKVKTVVVKTTKLKKKTVKGCFAKSKVKTVKVKVAKKKLKKTKKAYKKIFTKKICGKSVKVK